jgi:hypothetical protein
MQHAPLVDIEIDMHIEALAVLVIVRAAAKERFIGDQVGDARELAHEVQEGFRVDIFVKRRVKRAYIRNALDDGFSPDTAMLVPGIPVVERRKVPQERLAFAGLKKIVYDDVPKRLRFLKPILNFRYAAEDA